ncbi:bile acid:sodium symporter family protein [Bacillus sp. PS06]|uniref:bile acid:sodium symporter family protein n=1 Tax=Bacillus sp. PS06 TaxID=2764176 RepID=UPI00177BB8F6|nr:bile acid:sodium symporter family protein [Bacillus sp. PS06]MBD8071623.1 bile acid:sodium symporter family protein [Bacillus sp. PS06]
MLEKFDQYLKRFLPYFTVISLVIGILIGNVLENVTFIIPWLFALMTFSGSLGMSVKKLVEALQHPLPLVISLIILHGVMPIWAWSIGSLFFGSDSLTITGLVLATVIPIGVTSFIWIVIHGGNLTLGLAIILIDTMLAPFIITGSLKLFMGEELQINTFDLMVNLVLMIVLPCILAMFVNYLSKGKVKERYSSKLAPFSKVSIFIIVMINGGVISTYMKDIGWQVISIILVVFIISVSGFVISWVVARILHMPIESQLTVMYSSGMRNISAGSVIAVTYFPAEVVLPVVMGMLFQQVLAAFFGSAFQFVNRERRTMPYVNAN